MSPRTNLLAASRFGPCAAGETALAEPLWSEPARRLCMAVDCESRRYHWAGFQLQLLVTSLLNPERWAANALAALDHERWELEFGYDEVKREPFEREESVRSQSPPEVAQELWVQIRSRARPGRCRPAFSLRAGWRRNSGFRSGPSRARPGRRRAARPRNGRRERGDEPEAADELKRGKLDKDPGPLRGGFARFDLPERRSPRSFPRAVTIR